MWLCSSDYWKEFDNFDTHNNRWCFVHLLFYNIELQRVFFHEQTTKLWKSNKSLTAAEKKQRYVRIHDESTVFFECKWTISMICFYLSFFFSIFLSESFSLWSVKSFDRSKKAMQRRWSVDLTLKNYWQKRNAQKSENKCSNDQH